MIQRGKISNIVDEPPSGLVGAGFVILDQVKEISSPRCVGQKQNPENDILVLNSTLCSCFSVSLLRSFLPHVPHVVVKPQDTESLFPGHDGTVDGPSMQHQACNAAAVLDPGMPFENALHVPDLVLHHLDDPTTLRHDVVKSVSHKQCDLVRVEVEEQPILIHVVLENITKMV